MTPERWQDISRLFGEVLERDPRQRAAFLDEACAGDGDLRREVETLLSSRERMADQFLMRDALEVETRHTASAQATVQQGQRIAHFEVVSLLGAGAMGEVYLARDTRLDRKIALKLLPTRFTLDDSRLRRFEREARAVSSLNHPNIITVFDVGQESTDSVTTRHYIATEYVEGVTLRERLSQGATPPGEAAAIAIQVAAALEAAHVAGIIHRDIKPENVMIRPDGVVKVLDFGIVKLTEKSGGEQAASLVHQSTEEGTIIGTPGYMSPEQARGLDVDARTDIFSLGVLLYEMIAGRPPFCGESRADMIIVLLEREPERLSGTVPNISAELERFVGKALAKDRNERYETVTQLLRDLRNCQPTGNSSSVVWREIKRCLSQAAMKRSSNQAGRAESRPRSLAVWVLGGLTVLALAGFAYRIWQKPEIWAEPGELQFSTFVSKKSGEGGGLSRPVFSPDGKVAAYSLQQEESSQLWVKSLADERETRVTDGSWRDGNPIWSPDGKKLAFISNRTGQRDIWVVELARSKPRQPALLAKLETANTRLIAWGKHQQGERIYYETRHNLFVLDPVSTQVTQLTRLKSNDREAQFSLSPGLDRVVYLDKVNDEYCLMLKSLLDDKTTMLLKDSTQNRSPVWFPDGKKIAFCSNRTGNYQVYILWLDDRRVERVTSDNDNYSSVEPLPDGNSIAVNSTIENANLYDWDFGTKSESQHYSARGLQVLPDVSPDGSRVVFQTVSVGILSSETILIKPGIPGEPAVRLATGFRARWSPNGNALAFLRGAANAPDLWRVNPDDKVEERLTADIAPAGFTRQPYDVAYAEYRWTPDGSGLVYSSRKSGHSNLWQVAFDKTRDVRITDNTDDRTTVHSPRWSSDGGKLVYISNTQASTPQQSAAQRLHLLESGKSSVLLEREATLRILGWSADAKEVLLAASPQQGPILDKDIELLRLTVGTRRISRIGKVPDAYSFSLALAKNGRTLALSGRRNGRNNIELVSMQDGQAKQLTNNLDPATLYTSLSWAADGRRLFYSKQDMWREILLIAKKGAKE